MFVLWREYFFFAIRNLSLHSEFNTSVAIVEPMDCNIDRSNTSSFQIIFLMGVTFVTVSAFISYYINKIDRKKLLSKSFDSFLSLILCEWEKTIQQNDQRSFAVGWLFVCSGFAVSIALIPNFYIMAICFMIFLSCGLCAGIISAISVTIFPTNIR